MITFTNILLYMLCGMVILAILVQGKEKQLEKYEDWQVLLGAFVFMLIWLPFLFACIIFKSFVWAKQKVAGQ